MTSASLQYVTDENFDSEVFNSTVPVIVDFWAEWCGPCRQLGPIFEALAKDEGYQGKIKFAKCDIDANGEIAKKLGIRSIPTMIIFKNGTAADTKVGAGSSSDLRKFIDASL